MFSYIIDKQGQEDVLLRNLNVRQPVYAHSSNYKLYITLHSHVTKS